MKIRGFEPVSENYSTRNGEVVLPLRGTRTSAGYDFFAPFDLEIKPQTKVFFWTDVKAYMNKDEMLLLDVRSSSGVKLDLMLANTIGVIDSDYYDNIKTGGNIGICVRNLQPEMKLKGIDTANILDENGQAITISIPVIEDLRKKNTVYIKAGEAVAQGIFVSYLSSDNCNTDVERTDGLGHTNKKGDK